MMVTVVVNILNIIGNYSLIFGKFGMPALGVEGAAISTAFARGVSMVILFVILFRKHIPRFPLSYFLPLPVCRAEKPVENRSPLGRRKYVLQFLSGSIDLFY